MASLDYTDASHNLHLRNLFTIARNHILQATAEKVFEKYPEAGTLSLLRQHQERYILDYLYRNFRVPIKITTTLSGDIETRYGEPVLRICLAPFDGISNLVSGLKVGGFAIAVLPADTKLHVDHVSHALFGNCYSGEYFQYSPEKNVEFCDRPAPKDFKKGNRGSLIFTSIGASKLNRRINKLAADEDISIRSLGSITTEALHVFSGRADACLYPEGAMNFAQGLAIGRVAKALRAPFTTVDGEPAQVFQTTQDKCPATILSSSSTSWAQILKETSPGNTKTKIPAQKALV